MTIRKHRKLIWFFAFLLMTYSALWITGYMRVQFLVDQLKDKHERIKERTASLKEGDDEKKLLALSDIVKVKNDGYDKIYYYNYHGLIEENSSVSNRLTKCYEVTVRDGVIISMFYSSVLDHGDRFDSLWLFYLRVGLFGIDLEE